MRAYLIPALSLLLLSYGLGSVGHSSHDLRDSDADPNHWQSYSAQHAYKSRNFRPDSASALSFIRPQVQCLVRSRHRPSGITHLSGTLCTTSLHS